MMTIPLSRLVASRVTTAIPMSPTSLSRHSLDEVSLIASHAMTISASVAKDVHAARKESTSADLLIGVAEEVVVSTYVVWRAVPRMLPLLSVMDARQGEIAGLPNIRRIPMILL